MDEIFKKYHSEKDIVSLGIRDEIVAKLKKRSSKPNQPQQQERSIIMDPISPPLKAKTNTTTTSSTSSTTTTTTTQPTSKPILTSSALLNNTNILFNFERTKSDSSSSLSKKPKKEKIKESTATTTTATPTITRPCKICNKKSHQWKNCPTPDINKTCTNCNKIGHIAVNCNVIILNFKSTRHQQQESSSSSRPPRKQFNKDEESINNKDIKQSPTTSMKEKKQPKETTKPSSSPILLSQQQSIPTIPPTPTTITTTIQETLKYSKTLSSEQIYLTDGDDQCHSLFDRFNSDDIELAIDDQIEILKQCNIHSICIPMKTKSGSIFYTTDNQKVLSNQQPIDNNKINTIKQFIKKANAANISTPLSVSVQLDNTNLLKNPNWKQQPEQLQLICLNNKEFIEYFNILIQDLINRFKQDVGVFSGIYFDNIQTDKDSAQCTCQYCKDSTTNQDTSSTFKQNLSTLIRNGGTTIKNNQSMNQIIHFQQSNQFDSNIKLIHFNNSLEFSFLSRYNRMINQTIGLIKLNIQKISFDCLKFRLFYSMLLNAKCGVELENNKDLPIQIANHQSKIIFKQLKSVFEKTISMETQGKGIKTLNDIGLFYHNGDNILDYFNLISILEDKHYQFDIIDENITQDKLSNYKLIILSESNNNNNNNNGIFKKLTKYQQEQGGSILIFGDIGFSTTTKKSIFSNSIKYSNINNNNLVNNDVDIIINDNNISKYNILNLIDETNLISISSLYLPTRKGTRIEPIGNDCFNILSIKSIIDDNLSEAGIVYDKKQRVVHAIHPLAKIMEQQSKQAIGEIIHQSIRLLLPEPIVQLTNDNGQQSIKIGILHQQQSISKHQHDPINQLIIHLVNSTPNIFTNVDISIVLPKSTNVENIISSSSSSIPFNQKLQIVNFKIPFIQDLQTIIIQLK
ncbi:hypothetical protein DFA_04584 [Cavenderia fasciculata]|uniref:CCHC-type domain-containing protein n=1 Tax=Cavenderia fasciculata TaxID=261658 RepID=F4PPZ5_CACFS|nr:uncharacterized protein DFA_04584 [Cavenderia fasciculata]EGG22458.1 hypothetical protein DFA_04584 [Cavenderia fasciculata]|eukprot:XP_004360309.1 hypothetical protein DFA_04584 [Cavenderia fasciculata]